MGRKRKNKAAVSGSSNDTLEFQTLKTTEHNEIHRWAPDIPRNMTFMLRLDTGSPIIGDRAPKPTRYESSGAPETCEHSFQVTLPPKEPSEKHPEEDACLSQSSTSEDVSDSPEPSTPDEMYFEHCLPFPGMLADPSQFGPWPVGNPSDAMLLDSAQFPYPFLPEYPPNHLATPGAFTFEDCSANFSGQQHFLGNSDSSSSFSFPSDLQPTLGENWAMLDKQNSVGYTPDVMGPASFNDETVNQPGFRSDLPTAQQSRPTPVRRGNERAVSVQQKKRGRKKPATTEDRGHQSSRRPSNKNSELPAVSKNSSDRQPKSKKMRKIAPAEPNVHPGRPPALPLLPSLPSIFPPEWYGSNILEKRFLGEHGRNYVPIRPAPPAFEPIPPSMPPSAYSNYIPPAPYPPATPDRQNTQASFSAPSPNTTLRPAVWPFPPPVPMHPDPRHGSMPQYPPMPFVYGPGYFPPPPFGFMGPPFPFQYPRGESWTEHFDLLQDELQERRRLQKIQDRFVDPRKPQKRRSLYYPCPLCDRSFLRRNSLALHIKWHYDPREEPIVPVGIVVPGGFVTPGADVTPERPQEHDEPASISPSLLQNAPAPGNATKDAPQRATVRNISSLLAATQPEVDAPITPLATPPGTPLIRISKRPAVGTGTYNTSEASSSSSSRLRSDTVSSEKSMTWSLFGSPIQDRSP